MTTLESLELLADRLAARFRGLRVWPVRRFSVYVIHPEGVEWISVIGGLRAESARPGNRRHGRQRT